MTVSGQATVEPVGGRAPETVGFDPLRARKDFPILQTEGFVLIWASSEINKLGLNCCAFVFWASGRTSTDPLKTPREWPPRIPL